ncbi:MAG: HIT family protein [Candidatus Binataceae bacterium]|nr:HIT family protein [Candidatus Binataceae bacterium]
MMSRPEAAPVPGCGICGLIAQIRAGGFEDFIVELDRHFVILGEAQFYRGYCALLMKSHCTELHALPPDQARGAFDEVLLVAASIASVVRPLRLNYENLGNQEPHLHWHIFPRFEDDLMRLEPVWMRPPAQRKVTLEEQDRRALIGELRAEINRRRRF